MKELIQKQTRNKKTKASHFEIIYLLKFFKPIEIVREFGFSKPTVYLYSKRLREAKRRAIELLKRHPKFASLREEEIEKLLSF